MLGATKFELVANVQLTTEEAELVRKYRAEKEVLLRKDIKIPLTGRSLALDLTIGSLTNGQRFKCDDIAEILEYEKNVKECCAAFKNYLRVMQQFGGQEVIEY
jgi:hypothetical protein